MSELLQSAYGHAPDEISSAQQLYHRIMVMQMQDVHLVITMSFMFVRCMYRYGQVWNSCDPEIMLLLQIVGTRIREVSKPRISCGNPCTEEATQLSAELQEDASSTSSLPCQIFGGCL